MLRRAESYEAASAAFSWEIPARYNIGVDVCDRWAAREPDRLAMLALDRTDGPVDVTYGELRALSNQLANALATRGIGRKVDATGALIGDRVGVLLPQRLETAVAHIAALKLGADYAHAVDIDPEAIEAAEENAERNIIGDRIKFFVSDGPPDCAQNSGIEPFDLVFANIYAEKLVDMSEALTVCVKNGGRLVLSGIESVRRNLVEDAFARNGLPLEMEWQRGEWVTLAFRC